MDGLQSAIASFVVNRETGELEPRQRNDERRIGSLITRIRNSIRESRANSERMLSESDNAGFTVNGRVVTDHFTRAGREGLLGQPRTRIDVMPEGTAQQVNEQPQEIPEHERQLSVILATHYGITLHEFHRLLNQRNEGTLSNRPQYDDDLPSYESCSEYRDIFLRAIRENEEAVERASQMPESSL